MSMVAVVKTTPETVIQDYKTLLERAHYDKILRKEKEVLLKLNLSWSMYFPSCSTQPWQLDGVLHVLADNYTVIPVENKTVVTDPLKGCKANKWSNVLIKYNLKFVSLTDVKWVKYRPRCETPALDEIFPHGFEIPEIFKGRDIVHLPTVKCVHPETEIVCDGEFKTIKECVDRVHAHTTVKVTRDQDEVASSSHEVLSLGVDGHLRIGKAYQFWKTPAPETVVEVRTRTGKMVKTSVTHPFLTPQQWVKAQNLGPGDRIAVPRRIKKVSNGKFQDEIKYIKLTSGDILWDYIEEIEEIECDVPYLYDLSVEATNNFIGNGVVLHNTHGHTVTTGAVKNAFGGLLKEHRHHSHKLIHEVLVDLLKIQKEIHPGIFAVMDGTVCGDGAGPRTMVPHCKGFILASDDQVAIDAVAAKLMGFEPLDIQYINQAHREGLGVGDIDEIDIVGEDISNTNFGFQSKKSPVIFWDQMFRQKKLKFLEKLVFHTPLFRIPVALSEIYHDYFWYPTVGRKRIRDFRKTEWGLLFEDY